MKIKVFLKKYAPLLVAMLVALLAYMLTYIIGGYYPFGMNTIVRYDSFHQVLPYTSHLLDVLLGDSTLAYSSHLAGGMDVFGTILYMCVSPFTILLLIVGRGGMWQMMSFMYILKSWAMMITMYIMLISCFKNIKKPFIFIMLLAYAFGGYFSNIHNFMTWLDFMIYLPIVVIGYKKLIEKKSITLFVISLCCIMITNISLVLLGMILSLTIMLLYPVVCLDKEDRNRVLSKIIISHVMAIIILLPVIISFVFVTKDSSRLLVESFSLNIYHEGIHQKISFVLIDAMLLALCCCGLFKKNKTNEMKFFMIAIVLAFLPIAIDQLQILMCAGSYFGFGLRFGYMYTIIAFTMVAYMLNQQEDITLPRRTTGTASLLYFFILIFTICFILISIFLLNDINLALSQSLWTICLFVITLFVPLFFITIAMYWGIQQGKVSKRLFLLYLIVATCCPMFFTFTNVIGNVAIDMTNYKIYETIINEYQLVNKRVKFDGEYRQSNMGLMLGTIEYSAFSSSIHQHNISLAKHLNYDTNQQNSIDSTGGTILSDAIMGYDYYVTNYEWSLPYLQLLGVKEGYYVYKNTLSLLNGFCVQDAFLNYEYGYVTQNQNNLYHWLGGVGDIAKNESLYNYLPNDCVVYENSIPQFQLQKYKDVEGITIPMKKGYQYYLVGDNLTSCFDSYTIHGTLHSLYSDTIINLGYADQTQDFTFQLNMDPTISQKQLNDFYLEILTINVDLLTETLENVKNVNGFITNEKNKISYSFDKESKYYVLPYVALEGFKDIDFVKNDLNIMMVENKEGEMLYHSPYIQIFLYTLCVSILLIIILLVGMKFGWWNWLDRIAYCVFLPICVGLLAIMVCIGQGLELISIINFLFVS